MMMIVMVMMMVMLIMVMMMMMTMMMTMMMIRVATFQRKVKKIHFSGSGKSRGILLLS